MVLNIDLTICIENRFFWYSFILITWCQYSAHSWRPKVSQRYTRLRMSFWKHDPPKPTDAFRNFGPMRGSEPIAREISETSASVASQRAEIELMLDTRWASTALATSLESSDDQRLVVMICGRAIHCAYTLARVSTAARPSGVCSPPISTRAGFCRSSMAVPSARNSGFDSTWKVTPSCADEASTRLTAWAVRTGTVDFSTTILLEVAISAILRAQSSQFLTLAARPAPIPWVLVGVLTEMKMMSASAMVSSMAVEKNMFLPRTDCTTSRSPGSKMGRLSEFQAPICFSEMSTTVTLTSGQLAAMTAMVGPPT
mmetsp:Transcript_26117/g.61218  ORF Transcript_26117/g.61218 Transcript_26117/m.61218 type:complete len:313 (+) Transcript_26117:564-1502(+)